MGNPDAKAAAKRAKEARRQQKVKLRIAGRESTKKQGTRRKHIQGNNSSNDYTKDPRANPQAK